MLTVLKKIALVKTQKMLETVHLAQWVTQVAALETILNWVVEFYKTIILQPNNSGYKINPTT